MSLELNLRDLITRTGTEFKTVRAATGNNTDLSTTAKSTLVAAINEIAGAVAGSSGIDDGTTGSSSTWSSQKIATEITAVVTQIVGSAPAALDTLHEIADALQNDPNILAAIQDGLAKRVGVAAQTFTAPEQQQARANIGAVWADDIGDTETDLVAVFEAALV